MSISTAYELAAMQAAGALVAKVLREMMTHAKAGVSTQNLDNIGGALLIEGGGKSAPATSYNFPGHTCISVNNAMAHGIPSASIILQEGDLVNIDVSAELNGFWADNGCSFVVGQDLHGHQPLVDASRSILWNAIREVSAGVRISDIGYLIENEANRLGYKVIRNLAGHGVGRALHELPEHIPNFGTEQIDDTFQLNSTVAIETFIATDSDLGVELADGWTMVGNNGGYVCQHEHSIMVTAGQPVILTAGNGV